MDQETRGRAYDEERYPADHRLTSSEAEPGQGGEADDRHSAGETVDAVHEVVQIRHPDERQHRDGQREQPEG